MSNAKGRDVSARVKCLRKAGYSIRHEVLPGGDMAIWAMKHGRKRLVAYEENCHWLMAV